MLALLPHVAALVATHLALASPSVAQRQVLPVEVHAYWQNTIYMVPDPRRDGTPTPGLVGRLLLIGGDGRPVICDGSVAVKLYNDAPPNGGPPVLIEAWNIDKDNLKSMIQRDLVGYGYTLFLPTAMCNEHFTKVHLTLAFTPEKGGLPLLAPPNPMQLRSAH